MTSQSKSKQPEVTASTKANAPAPAHVQAGTKIAMLIQLLTRADGATLEQMVAVTGWLPHTTRAALTRLKARGYAVTSVKVDGVRTYRASGSAAS